MLVNLKITHSLHGSIFTAKKSRQMSYNTPTPLSTWVDGGVWVSSPRYAKELLLCQAWLSFLGGGDLCWCVGFPSCGEWGLLSSCSAWAYYCSDFFCCRAWALGHEGSVVVTHELISSAACGIPPDQGSHLCPLHWQVDSQQLIHQGSPSPSF